MKMKIIMDRDSERVTNHAKAMAKMSEKITEDNIHYAKPLGVAYHTTRYPHTCDDCGQTFWDRDTYGLSHIGCRGSRGKAGF